MDKNIVKFQTAKLAREKGFNVETMFVYSEESGYTEKVITQDLFGKFGSNHNYFIEMYGGYLFAPTQEELSDWLRESYGINIEVRTFALGYWVCHHNAVGEPKDMRWNVKNQMDYQFTSHGDAFEEGLIQALQKI